MLYKFQHIDSNIPMAHVHRVYISQYICYACACSLYSDFLQSTKLLNPESSHLLKKLCIKNLLHYFGYSKFLLPITNNIITNRLIKRFNNRCRHLSDVVLGGEVIRDEDNIKSLLLFVLIQIQGIEDLYVFDGGSVTVDTNGSIGMTTPAHVSLKSLHVQDKGTFQMDSHTKDNMFVMDSTNVTVSL